ncbi:MAG: polyprenyl synthetase family protein, partial [Promethearchaeota archaeon]
MIEEFLKTEKDIVDKELESYFITLNNNEQEVLLKDFVSQLKTFILNEKAKRLHPILLIASFIGIVNPIYLSNQIEQINKLSISVELLHSGYLIHDDLIDEDEKRRSNPTFHIQLKNEINKVYKNLEFSNKDQIINMYGRDMSILGGIQGYLLGLDVIKASKFPEHLKLLAINEYTTAM